MKPRLSHFRAPKRRVRLGRRAHARAMVNPRARGGIILNRDRRICDAHVISPAMFLIALGHRRCSHNVGTGSKVKRSQILQPRKSRSTEIGFIRYEEAPRARSEGSEVAGSHDKSDLFNDCCLPILSVVL